MPHDRKNKAIQIGDVVMVPAIVTGVDKHEDFINLALETIETMYPGEHKTPLLLNCRQVEVINPTIGVVVVNEISE